MKWMTRTKVLIAFGALILLGVPIVASAHVHWFIDAAIEVTTQETIFLWIGAAVFTVLFFVLRALSGRPVGGNYVKVLHLQAMPFVGLTKNVWSVGLGLTLLIFAARGELFSPDLVVTSDLGQFIRILMIIAGLGFVILMMRRWVSILLLLALVLLWVEEGVVTFFEHTEYLGLAFVFLFAYTQGKFSLRFAMRYARIGLGLALLVAAFHEKLTDPGLGLAFLEQYDWNIFANLGLPVSNLQFVYLAGLTEAFIGLLLIMNIFPRFAGLAVIGLFTVTFFLLGVDELIGHTVAGLIALFVALYGTDYFHFTEEQEIEL